MIRHYILRVWLLVIFLLNTSFTYAEDFESVKNWTQEVLISTLAASYLDTPTDVKSVEQFFYPVAWDNMVAFLSDKREIIDTQKLILHPRPITPPEIIKSGYCDAFRCWRVNQSINIPELRLNLDISVLVVTSKVNTPFLIQSLDMNLHNY